MTERQKYWVGFVIGVIAGPSWVLGSMAVDNIIVLAAPFLLALVVLAVFRINRKSVHAGVRGFLWGVLWSAIIFLIGFGMALGASWGRYFGN